MWEASIRRLNLGTWADGEQVVQPTVPSQECVGCGQIPLRRGHLLMSRESVKGW
jgi:hypothetical protein